MRVVTQYGTMWARNPDNIASIPKDAEGVYVLFDGSMPLYAAKGNIQDRVTRARRSKRRGQLWDRFSWYAIQDPQMIHDIEVLVLRVLPQVLRSLTRQEGHFLEATKVPESKTKTAEYITRKPRTRRNEDK
jgi:hypothetical protein